jgi:hypothetical protein
MNQVRVELIPVGWVQSPLTDRASALKQGHEGSPEAWLVFEPWVLQGIEGIREGDEVIFLTWLDRARRDVLRVHPRGDARSLSARGGRGCRGRVRPQRGPHGPGDGDVARRARSPARSRASLVAEEFQWDQDRKRPRPHLYLAAIRGRGARYELPESLPP